MWPWEAWWHCGNTLASHHYGLSSRPGCCCGWCLGLTVTPSCICDGFYPSQAGEGKFKLFATFSRKLYEIERIWVPGGGGGRRCTPLDPPMCCDLYGLKRWYWVFTLILLHVLMCCVDQFTILGQFAMWRSFYATDFSQKGPWYWITLGILDSTMFLCRHNQVHTSFWCHYDVIICSGPSWLCKFPPHEVVKIHQNQGYPFEFHFYSLFIHT